MVEKVVFDERVLPIEAYGDVGRAVKRISPDHVIVAFDLQAPARAAQVAHARPAEAL
jgi:hypothetical protein